MEDNTLKKYNYIHIDGSFSPCGGSVICFRYSNGKHKILTLPDQNDSFETEYMAFIKILSEINSRKKKNKIMVVTDCLNLYNEVYGNKLTTKPILLEKTLDLMEKVNVQLIWKPRQENAAGHILEQRINSLRGMRSTKFQYHRYYKRKYK